MISLFNRFIQPGSTIGIIGGGQLGRMMTFCAKEAGYRVIVLEPGEDSPAGQVADEQIIASYDDREALEQLAQKSDVITFEFENIDYDALHWLQDKAYVPQGAEIIRVTQDRILEKQSLTDAGVKVAPYAVINNEQDLLEKINEIGIPSVLKTSRGGYDGKGQYVIKEKSDITQAQKLLEHGPCVLESWIAYDKEISVVMTGGINNELTFFPIGENIHVNNILHETIVPARTNTNIEEKVHALAKKIAQHFQLVGTLAVEMFLTEDGDIYVNELAPRPHNSGHYTIEACNISQFGQHIRAVCGLPLQEIYLLQDAVMVNVLGQHMEKSVAQMAEKRDWSFHFYGKAEAKHDRKMGHITIATKDIESTLQIIEASNIWN